MVWSRHVAAAVALFIVLASGEASADVVFTNRTDWENVLESFETEDFNSVATGLLSLGSNSVGILTIDIANDTKFTRIDPGGGSFNADGTNHVAATLQAGVNSITINFGKSVNAFAADWVSIATGSNPTQGVIASYGSETLVLSGILNNGFIGVVSSTSFDSVTLTSGGFEDFGFDNVSFGVPEPSGLLLLGAAGLALCVRRRRRARRTR